MFADELEDREQELAAYEREREEWLAEVDSQEEDYEWHGFTLDDSETILSEVPRKGITT